MPPASVSALRTLLALAEKSESYVRVIYDELRRFPIVKVPD